MPTQSDKNDCNNACTGDQSESCGGGGRILVYKDSDYIEPSDAEFVAALKAWREVLDRAREQLAEFYRLVTLFNAQSPNDTIPTSADGKRNEHVGQKPHHGDPDHARDPDN